MKKLFAVLVVFCLFAGIFAIASAGEQKDEKIPLEKVTFIHYKKGFAKPSASGNSKPVNCYAFLASGAKWKTNEGFLINPSNNDGLSTDFVQSSVLAGIEQWETYGGDIFGAGTIDGNATYIDSTTDGKNTVSFGNYSNSGIIAVTTVWGYFSGRPQSRYLVEWDLLFNDNYFTFGDAAINPGLMDLQAIATHELGHAVGMGDLYNTACFEETMFGYSGYGETIKRDLHSGDIAGIKKLYSG